jgi:hypothetical protein
MDPRIWRILNKSKVFIGTFGPFNCLHAFFPQTPQMPPSIFLVEIMEKRMGVTSGPQRFRR